MKTIYKYPLLIEDRQEVLLPVGAKVLCVQVQREAPCLWALVDATEMAKLPHVIHTRGTGHPADSVASFVYLGTYQMASGRLVFHVFHEGPSV